MVGNSNKNLLALAIIIAGALIAGAFIYTDQSKEGSLSSQEAADKAIAFINQTIEEDISATLLDVTEEAGLYKIHLQIADTEYNSYITKDGKLLFPNAFNLEEQAIEQPEATSSAEPNSLDGFAQCLTSAGMKFYGSKNCGWCAQEKELFGDSMAYINYIECVDEETGGLTAECEVEGILTPGGLGVPTWQLPNGEMSSGYKSFEQLAELSGCSLE